MQNTAVTFPADVSTTIVDAAAVAGRIAGNVATVIVGKDDVIEQALAALIAEGHILVEDVPGVGKTMLARSIAVSIGGTFSRIQFTPDLLPSDVTGVSVYNQSSGEFSFRSGPIAAQLVLPTKSTGPPPKPSRRCWKPWKSARLPLTALPIPCPGPSWSLPRRTPSSTREPSPCPKPSWTVS